MVSLDVYGSYNLINHSVTEFRMLVTCKLLTYFSRNNTNRKSITIYATIETIKASQIHGPRTSGKKSRFQREIESYFLKINF